MNTKTLIHIHNLNKTYEEGGRARHVLQGVDLEIYEGEFFVMLGKSGSGKSTLLNLISGIDKPDNPDTAKICIDDTDITKLNDTQQTLFRRDHIGIVFQFFNLIPTLTVLENITLPLELRGDNRKISQKTGLRLLERVGLGNRGNSFPDKLSGGEQQRVAIARALAHEPKLVLADEPTGNLDEETGERVLALLLELTREDGKTLVMATHNPEIVPYADRVCRIHDGKLQITDNRHLEVVI
ncbi:MAG: ABC transporter ATP-binding protein [Phototrophicales bacterium]|nr:MAG: ABC transporter ATP-binding protein [Phototrophicales bacterium]